jgi:diguanylate cyclase (GGDEF)-like protein
MHPLGLAVGRRAVDQDARRVRFVGEGDAACDEALQQAGFAVEHADAANLPAGTPAAWIVHLSGHDDAPLLRCLQTLQGEPVPILLLLDDLTALAAARRFDLPLLDFALRSHDAIECVRRLELALELHRRFASLTQRTARLERQISVDFKTGLLSELHFRRVMQLECKRAQRHHNPLALLLLDLDDFKGINDATSYDFGDETLRRVGETVLRSVRETDFAARLGGDEFCVLLPQTSSAEAMQTALRIRRQIAGIQLQHGTFRRQLTVSIGIDTFDGHMSANASQLRQRANHALHAAKRQGKNQVRSFAPSLSALHNRAL